MQKLHHLIRCRCFKQLRSVAPAPLGTEEHVPRSPLSEVAGLRAGVVPPTSKLLPAPLTTVIIEHARFRTITGYMRPNGTVKTSERTAAAIKINSDKILRIKVVRRACNLYVAVQRPGPCPHQNICLVKVVSSITHSKLIMTILKKN
jgi:hypothetical protein